MNKKNTKTPRTEEKIFSQSLHQAKNPRENIFQSKIPKASKSMSSKKSLHNKNNF
jgi:hypothetical protein